MKNDPTSQAVDDLVGQHAKPIARGARESHTVESLAKRIGASPDAVEGLVGAGILQSDGPLSRSQPGGPHVFDSDHLDNVRKQVMQSVAADAIETGSGEPDEIPMAVGRALREHVTKHSGPATKSNEFSRALGSGAVMLSAYGRQQDDEEKPTFADRIARGAAVVGTGAAVLGGAAYLRGRMLRKPGGPASLAEPGLRGVANTIKAGAGALVGDARNAGATVADVLRKARARVAA